MACLWGRPYIAGAPRGRRTDGPRLRACCSRPTADAEKVWLEEAERRLGELTSGKVAGIPAEKVIKKARAALR